MDGANFISLGGSVEEKKSKEQKEEDRKARRERGRLRRTELKKEKKQVKSEAKKERHENGILHRRSTRNNEKYSKNNEYKKQLVVDLERCKIRREAVDQVEKLAAEHDKTGKLFNVSEITVNENGKVISAATIERKALEKTFNETNWGIKTKLPKKQQKRRRDEWLAQQPCPPKPVIPEGYSIPEGEEDFLGLWDITDEQIRERLSKAKNEKKSVGKAKSEADEAEKRFRKKLRMSRKEAVKKGIPRNRAAARQQILEEEAQAQSGSESGQGSSAEEDSSSESESEDAVEDEEEKKASEKAAKKAKKAAKKAAEQAQSVESPESKESGSKKRKRNVDAEPVEEQSKKSKKHKKSSAESTEAEPATSEKASKKSKKAPAESNDAKLDALIAEQNRLRDATSSDAQPEYSTYPGETATIEAEEVSERKLKKKNKKKAAAKSSEEIQEEREKEALEAAKAAQAEREAKEEKKQRKKEKKAAAELASGEAAPVKKQKVIVDETSAPQKPVAAHWNASALTGGNARQDKFLRLLGAGKSAAVAAKPTTTAAGAGKIDVGRMQTDLERQFEAGNQRKHDGGGKRRGLGA